MHDGELDEECVLHKAVILFTLFGTFHRNETSMSYKNDPFSRLINSLLCVSIGRDYSILCGGSSSQSRYLLYARLSRLP